MQAKLKGFYDEHLIAMRRQCEVYGLSGGHDSPSINDATLDRVYTYVERGHPRPHLALHTKLGFISKANGWADMPARSVA